MKRRTRVLVILMVLAMALGILAPGAALAEELWDAIKGGSSLTLSAELSGVIVELVGGEQIPFWGTFHGRMEFVIPPSVTPKRGDTISFPVPQKLRPHLLAT